MDKLLNGNVKMLKIMMIVYKDLIIVKMNIIAVVDLY